MAKTALIVLAEGFEEVEAVTPIDLLRRAGIAVTVAGLGSTTVRGSHAIPVTADKELSAGDTVYDALVLPGGQPGTTNLAASGLLLSLVRTYAAAGKVVAAICAAPSVLAAAGVLAGKTATCYPGVETKLAGARVTADAVVVDGNIVTGRAAGAAVQFSLAVIARLSDRASAQSVADKIVYTPAW